MKYLLWLFLALLLVSLASAEIQTLPPQKQGECMQIVQSNTNVTFINLTKIDYPSSCNKTTNYTQIAMLTSNNINYYYDFCDTECVGEYIVSTGGDVDGVLTSVDYNFEITPSGFGRIGIGEGISFFVAIFIILIIAIALLVLGFKSSNVAARIGFFTFSVIIFVIAILYSIVSIQQNLYGYESMISGIESFWSVMKILAGVGFLILMVIIALIMIKYWKIKRGYVDPD